MALATHGKLVWLGMILSGIALGAYVLVSWPDTSTRLTRLPYGESMPKTPRTPAKAPVVKSRVVPTPDAELTIAAPAPKPARTTAGVKPTRAPVEAEVASEESPEELGAASLPGTARATPVERKAAATPVQPAPAAEPEPTPAPEEPPVVEIMLGSSPPSGHE